VTRQGSKAFEVICAIKVQTIFRGFSARRRFYINIRSHYQLGKGGISNHRTKFYENELNMYTNKMDKDFDDRKKESDSLLRYDRSDWIVNKMMMMIQSSLMLS
jgi:hypothetical protein